MVREDVTIWNAEVQSLGVPFGPRFTLKAVLRIWSVRRRDYVLYRFIIPALRMRPSLYSPNAKCGPAFSSNNDVLI